MELKWNKFVQEDKNSYPKNDGNYSDKIYCHFNKGPYCFNGKSLVGYFDIDSHSFTVLYWAEVPDPEEFKKDFPF